ncbi:MAG: portal protein, partial [Beijerinckiaceae bacterium]
MKERDDFTRTMLSRAEGALSHNSAQFIKLREDRLFCDVPGHQWDKHLEKKRANRPCYEFNRTRQLKRRITGQMLQNKPMPKAFPVENGDMDGAEVRSGLIRFLMSTDEADTAISTANDWAVTSGYGAARVISRYASDDVFDQDLVVEEIDDPSRLRFDPASRKRDRRDARYLFLYGETIPRDTFKARYPDKPLSDFTTGSEATWFSEDGVVIA